MEGKDGLCSALLRPRPEPGVLFEERVRKLRSRACPRPHGHICAQHARRFGQLRD